MNPIAKQIADRLWPVAGDPTFPDSREESDGWMRAYEAANAGLRDAIEGRITEPLDNEQIEQMGGHVGAHAYAAGVDEGLNHATTNKTTSLRDWNNEQPITYLWICGVGCPAGMDFRHDTETQDDEEYCDFAELDLLGLFWDLEGTIDDNGRWCWNGEGDVRDEVGNTIYNVKASRTTKP